MLAARLFIPSLPVFGLAPYSSGDLGTPHAGGDVGLTDLTDAPTDDERVRLIF